MSVNIHETKQEDKLTVVKNREKNKIINMKIQYSTKFNEIPKKVSSRKLKMGIIRDESEMLWGGVGWAEDTV